MPKRDVRVAGRRGHVGCRSTECTMKNNIEGGIGVQQLLSTFVLLSPADPRALHILQSAGVTAAYRIWV